MPEQFPTLPPPPHGAFLCSHFTAWIQQRDLWAGAELGMRTALVSQGLGLTMQNGGAERLLQLQGGRNWREEGYSGPDSSAFH